MHGLYLLWWVQEKHMPPAVVGATLAVGDLALIALELPTGWFADRFGHRVGLMLGSFIQVLGMVWCWLGEGVSGLLIASALVALGDAFRSGADQALLYRTCVAIDRESEFQTIEARAEAVALGALVVLVLLGGLVVHQIGFAAGWLAETLLCGVGLAIACAMQEPPREEVRTFAEQPSRTNSARIEYRSLIAAIAPAAVLGGAVSACSFFAQTTAGNHPAFVTFLVAALTAAEAAGSALAACLPMVQWRVQIQLAALGAILLMTGMAITTALIPAAVVLAFLAGVAQPLRAASIQRLAADHIRARAASAASACDMALTALVLPLTGLWVGRRR
jgi:MFS family permease